MNNLFNVEAASNGYIIESVVESKDGAVMVETSVAKFGEEDTINDLLKATLDAVKLSRAIG